MLLGGKYEWSVFRIVPDTQDILNSAGSYCYHYGRPSVLSVTCKQPQAKNIKWNFSEINKYKF